MSKDLKIKIKRQEGETERTDFKRSKDKDKKIGRGNREN